jgi:hypothetical protein
MKKELEYCTSDKVNWFKNHTMSEEQRKKMIEDKLKRAFKQVELESKIKVLMK